MSLQLLTLVFLIVRAVSAEDSNKQYAFRLQVIYWQVKPFIYLNEKTGNMKGIYPMIFRKGAAYCTTNHDTEMLDYVKDFGSRTAFDMAMRSNTNYGEGVLENITTPGAVAWISYDSNIEKIGAKHFLRRNLTVLSIARSERLAVILQQRRIALPNKIIRGMRYCNLIIVISFILALFFGLIIWIIERPYNPAFQNKDGPILGLYLSFVTMSTVGYGDIVPVTIPGKMISVVWMGIGILVAAVMVATLTDVVTGTEGLGIDGKRVSVIKDSHEEYFVERDYFAQPILFDTYEEVIQAVRDGDVYAGVLPHDIAVWMGEEIIDSSKGMALSVVYLLEGIVPFNILVTATVPGGEEVIECMTRKYKHEVTTSSIELYKRHMTLSITHYGGVFDVFLNNVLVQIISGLTLFVLIVSIFIYSFSIKKRKVTEKSMKKKNIDEAVRELSVMLKEYKEMVKNEDAMDLTTIATTKH